MTTHTSIRTRPVMCSSFPYNPLWSLRSPTDVVVMPGLGEAFFGERLGLGLLGSLWSLGCTICKFFLLVRQEGQRGAGVEYFPPSCWLGFCTTLVSLAQFETVSLKGSLFMKMRMFWTYLKQFFFPFLCEKQEGIFLRLLWCESSWSSGGELTQVWGLPDTGLP